MGEEEEAITSLRRKIVEANRRNDLIVGFDDPAFNLIRDDPEFQRLMDIVDDDRAVQLERVREMERNGELAPAPGVLLD